MEQPRLFGSISRADSSVSHGARRLAMLAHLGWLLPIPALWFWPLYGLPLLPSIAALVMGLATGKESAWAKEQAKEAFNFQLFVLIAAVLLSFVRLQWIPLVYCFVMSIVASLSLRRGEPYTYAATYHFIK